MFTAAKEEMPSWFGDVCADLPLAAFVNVDENSPPGLEQKNPALHLEQPLCNSTTALGIAGTLALNGGGECPSGRENDGNGIYYYRARYYSTNLGRFISQDPIGFLGGINTYAYANDNPVDFIDLFGLETGNLNDKVPGPNGEVATGAPISPYDAGYTYSIFDLMNYVPSHGNWCGSNWSGGLNPTLNWGMDGTAGHDDALDALCEQHDHMYEHAKCKKDILQADEWLLQNAQQLPYDSRYRYYRPGLITAFRIKIALER